MRFRVCGGLDAPDWVLAAASRVGGLPAEGAVARLAARATRSLLAAGAAAAGADDGDGDGGGGAREAADLRAALGLASRTEVEAALGVVEFFMANSVKHEVRGTLLVNELTQLGLSKAGADDLEAALEANWDALRLAARQSVLRLARPYPGGRARIVPPLETSPPGSEQPPAQPGCISIDVVNQDPITFSADPAKLALLADELARAVDVASRVEETQAARPT